MSDDFHMDETTPPEAPSPGTTPAAAGRTVTSAFTGPQGMVALGGLILVGTYVIFGLLLNDYWVGWLAMLLAVGSLLLLRAKGTFVEGLAPVPVLAKVIGYLLAVIGVLALIEDLRFADGTLNEFPDVIGAIASYVGYGLAFIGARSIKV